jgi:hypothetical protein
MKTLGMVLSGQDNNAGADEKLKRKKGLAARLRRRGKSVLSSDRRA